MKSSIYSQWDGTQNEFSLDPAKVLDALSDLLMEGVDVREAVEWMRRHGFELGGLDMRVVGLAEMIDELREQADDLYERFRMDEALLDPHGASRVGRQYTRAYLHHLFKSGELLGAVLGSLHNTWYLVDLVRQLRQSIVDGTFPTCASSS